MSILSVDTIQPIGSGSTVTLNAAKIVVGTGITFESNGQAIYAGIITATSFVGGLPITNGADNRVITASSASALNGEANLTFDGNDLSVTGTAPAINFIDTDSDDYKIHNVQGVLKITDTTASADRFVINDNGTGYFLSNFQIGSTTSSPGATLHINTSYPSLKVDSGGHASDAYVRVISGNAQNSRVDFGDSDDDNIGIIDYDHANNSMSFTTNTTERLRIDSSGRLLIGTTDSHGSDADDIVVATSGTTGITIRSGTSGSGNIYFADGNSGTGLYRGRISYYHGDDSIFLGTANSARSLKITSDGSTQIESGVLQRRYESTNTAGYRYYSKADRFQIAHGGSGTNLTITGMSQGWASIRFGGYTEGQRVNFRADIAGYNAGNAGVRLYDSNEITNQATSYSSGSCNITVTKNNASYVVNVTQSNPQSNSMASFYYFETGGYNSVSTLTIS